MESNPTDERFLLSLLPEVVWRQVLECMEPHALLLVACSKAIPFFYQMLEKRGRVLVYPTKPIIFPRTIRDRITEQEPQDSEFLFMLDVLHKRSPRLTTLHVSSEASVIPLLHRFLEAHAETLENVSISGFEWSYRPPVLELPKMRKLRVLKLIRAFSPEQKTFTVDHPVYDVFPALESLTLSLGGQDQWTDLLRCSDQEQRQLCPTVRHLRLIDYRYAHYDNPHLAFLTLEKALKLFPNLVSVEIPARRGAEVVFQAKNLKYLTLTRDFESRDKHSFDMFLTGYNRETCADILEKSNRQPGIRKELEAERESNITNLQALQILRIKCSFATLGPTLVTFGELLKLKSLRIWEFCGHKPEYIPKKILDGKTTASFKISWRQCEVYDGRLCVCPMGYAQLHIMGYGIVGMECKICNFR